MYKTNKTLMFCLVFIFSVIFGSLGLNLIFFLLLISWILYLFLSKVTSVRFSLILFFLGSVGFFYTGFRAPVPDKLYYLAPLKVELKGRVLTQPQISASSRVKFELGVTSLKSSGKSIDIKGKTLVSSYIKPYQSYSFQQGDIVSVKGLLSQPEPATNPAQFDYKNYLAKSGVFTQIYPKFQQIKLISHAESGLWLIAQKITGIKNKIIDIHSKALKSPHIEVLGGIVFGSYAVPIPNEIKQDFINSGLLHILAASGMNVAMICGLWFFISKRLFIPHRISIAIGAVLVLIYAFLTGFPPSVIRALFMIEFVLLGKFLDKESNIIILLALVCSGMLLFNPLMINDVGFQLSFMVTLGLILCTSTFADSLKPIPEKFSAIVLVPIIAQLWAAPLQINYFNNFAVFSVLANVLVFPFMSLITYLGFIGSVLSLIPYIGAPVCILFDKVADPFIFVLLWITQWVSALPYSILYLAKPSLITMFSFYLVLIFLTFAIKNKLAVKKINIAVLICLIVFGVSLLKFDNSQKLKILVFNIGESDAIFIQTPDKKNLLVDTGNKTFRGYSPAKYIILPYFRSMGIKKLDAVILTHPDKDHIGGSIDILNGIKVNNVFDNGKYSNTKTYKRIKKYIFTHKIKTTSIRSNFDLNIDKNLKIKIFRNTDEEKTSKNENSLITLLSYKKFNALLMGDAEADSLETVKKYVKKTVNIIKIGHHGSKISVDKEFVKYLKLQNAVISVGKNTYSHPNGGIINLLRTNNVKVYRTDKDYAISIDSNGNDYRVVSYKDILKNKLY